MHGTVLVTGATGFLARSIIRDLLAAGHAVRGTVRSESRRAEAAQATTIGMRYFRVSIGVDRQPGEVSCPASAEAGRKAQCSDCLLCGGMSKQARSIVIADHAAGHQRRVVMLRAA
jgi:nucleoside-diphosphate-sugar epimerase